MTGGALNERPDISTLNESPDISRPSIADKLIGVEELAPALGLTIGQLKAKSWRLHRDRGFPPRLPGCGWRWSRRAVETWILAAGVPDAPDEEDVDVETPDARRGQPMLRLVAGQRASLEERYGERR